jgi:negative regulator of sigma E activity
MDKNFNIEKTKYRQDNMDKKKYRHRNIDKKNKDK